MAWQQPKTNWDTHPKAIEPADLNRIERNIEVVREQDDLPLRAQVVSSLPSPGTPGRLVFNDADKRFYFDTGTGWQVQSAPDLGKVILTPGTANVPIPEGYHDGTGYVVGDSNLTASNIKVGKNIFGVEGSYDGRRIIASEVLRISADTERIVEETTIVKRIRIGYSGTCRIKCDFKQYETTLSSGVRGKFQIAGGEYKKFTWDLNTYKTHTVEFRVLAGDILEFELECNVGAKAACRNFRVYYSFDDTIINNAVLKD